ncbi:hypothetical protein ANTPLA_LOCUS3799 [Anthophora plagiata]
METNYSEISKEEIRRHQVKEFSLTFNTYIVIFSRSESRQNGDFTLIGKVVFLSAWKIQFLQFRNFSVGTTVCNQVIESMILRDRAHTEYELAICYGIAFLQHFNLLILLPARHTQVLAPEITVL